MPCAHSNAVRDDSLCRAWGYAGGGVDQQQFGHAPAWKSAGVVGTAVCQQRRCEAVAPTLPASWTGPPQSWHGGTRFNVFTAYEDVCAK